MRALPSADEETNVNSPESASFGTQVVPELVEVQIDSPLRPLFTATNLLPSAEEATENQKLLGAVVWTHVWASSDVLAPHKKIKLTKGSRMIDFIAAYRPKI